MRELHASARALKWGGMHFRRENIFMGGEKKNAGAEPEYAVRVAEEDTVALLLSEARRAAGRP